MSTTPAALASAPAAAASTPAAAAPPAAASTPAAAAPPAHKNSFLKKLGHLGMDVVDKILPTLTKAAVAAEPIVDLLFPMEGPLYNTVVTAIVKAEVDGAQAAAGAQTGPEKFEAVWKAVSPQLLTLATSNGLLSADAEASVQKYIQAIFNILDGPVKATNAPAAAAAAVAPATPPAK